MPVALNTAASFGGTARNGLAGSVDWMAQTETADIEIQQSAELPLHYADMVTFEWQHTNPEKNKNKIQNIFLELIFKIQ